MPEKQLPLRRIDVSSSLRWVWCPRSDSNRHGANAPADFESAASAISPLGQREFASITGEAPDPCQMYDARGKFVVTSRCPLVAVRCPLVNIPTRAWRINQET